MSKRTGNYVGPYSSQARKAPKKGKSYAVSYSGPAVPRSLASYSVQKNSARARLSQKESGYVDLITGSKEFSTTGVIDLAITIPQDDTVHGRLGKRAKLKSFQIRGTMSNKSAATFNKVALMLVYDKRPVATPPSVSEILKSGSSVAMNNDNNSGRFQVLRRWDYILVGNPTDLLENTHLQINEFVDLKGRLIEYNDSAKTGAMGTIVEGAVYLAFIGNNATGTTCATGNMSCRARFIDI